MFNKKTIISEAGILQKTFFSEDYSVIKKYNISVKPIQIVNSDKASGILGLTFNNVPSFALKREGKFRVDLMHEMVTCIKDFLPKNVGNIIFNNDYLVLSLAEALNNAIRSQLKSQIEFDAIHGNKKSIFDYNQLKGTVIFLLKYEHMYNFRLIFMNRAKYVKKTNDLIDFLINFNGDVEEYAKEKSKEHIESVIRFGTGGSGMGLIYIRNLMVKRLGGEMKAGYMKNGFYRFDTKFSLLAN